ncbi:hypothetical protein H6501_02090 [Candidatus Woesearchaeota archaeon]|nr:hypothetical protein [Nanoarchaeota archaeon]MCB9370367.1 hypothetical protein [Candidatus Woesearchaeota archaeon]USN44888.1 MAG: hypothetical protein H6500_03535 [Candidatus Woesearchaeota archaeon]
MEDSIKEKLKEVFGIALFFSIFSNIVALVLQTISDTVTTIDLSFYLIMFATITFITYRRLSESGNPLWYYPLLGLGWAGTVAGLDFGIASVLAPESYQFDRVYYSFFLFLPILIGIKYGKEEK